ncbi:regulating synaptic membrane exocytosis protein 1 [Suricata suricatta]|uniref:regulating synaptic membrane exocytosis protein 1 n=1 Tax=Suricata suricatta TaxID=37032 RepID=UPI001155341B|nr:regulating synaptic membrane exocytosis protein 1 [Suricata suricatta]
MTARAFWLLCLILGSSPEAPVAERKGLPASPALLAQPRRPTTGSPTPAAVRVRRRRRGPGRSRSLKPRGGRAQPKPLPALGPTPPPGPGLQSPGREASLSEPRAAGCARGLP